MSVLGTFPQISHCNYWSHQETPAEAPELLCPRSHLVPTPPPQRRCQNLEWLWLMDRRFEEGSNLGLLSCPLLGTFAHIRRPGKKKNELKTQDTFHE